MGVFGSNPNSAPFEESARVLPGSDERFSGVFEGEYQDPDHQLAWERAFAAEAANPHMVYVTAYDKKRLEGTYDPHISWALRIIARVDEQISKAESAEQATLALRELDSIAGQNRKFFDAAGEFIAKQREMAEQAFLRLVKDASDAYDAGDKETYLKLERKLHDTGSIDTSEVRARIAADIALNE
jgi:hypothetical protein